jgi:hypothetical protein
MSLEFWFATIRVIRVSFSRLSVFIRGFDRFSAAPQPLMQSVSGTAAVEARGV